MKKLFITLALAIPMSLMAEEMADTTVVYNGKQVVISDDSLETRISVYSKNDNQLVKTSETKFVNKQEVERIYVSSPLLPSSSQFYSSMYPTIWWGTSSLATRVGDHRDGTTKAGLHLKDSYEIGVTTAEGMYPLNKKGDLLLSNAIQIILYKHNIQNSALLSNVGRHIAFEDRTNAPASSNYMMYSAMRLPFMLGWAPTVDWTTDWLNTQFGIGLAPLYRMKAAYVFEPEAFGDPIERKLKIYHWGLDLDMNLVCGPVKFSLSLGLLPVFKTTDGKKAYSSSVNFGVNIGELFGKRSQVGSF